jgi:uncharacterized protein YxeA
MKKILILMLVILILTFAMLFSIDKKQMEKWVTIITEKDAPTKMQKLEEFHTEYGDKNDQMTRLIYLNLTVTSYQVQKYDKTIEYGEKALTFAEVESADKLKNLLEPGQFLLRDKNRHDKGQQLRQHGHRIGQDIAGRGQGIATGHPIHRPCPPPAGENPRFQREKPKKHDRSPEQGARSHENRQGGKLHQTCPAPGHRGEQTGTSGTGPQGVRKRV